ncbi:MAG: glutamine-hydrolyzing GMP synthase, partial [Elusimicrobiaceae bacterium]|nr:glutamine-hydrolyzing GMP synthase [Elusimicrobiaceae bacterium]
MLGICYGMQMLSLNSGGKVVAGKKREYGFAEVKITNINSPLFAGLKQSKFTAWMSHGDEVTKLGKGYKILAKTANIPYAAAVNEKARRYLVQFHPEVAHTQYGAKLLANFAHKICGCKASWTSKCIVKESVDEIKKTVGKGHVICGLSGGVDSSVAAALIQKAIGKNLYCVFVDTGLLRSDDKSKMKKLAKDLKLNLKIVDATNMFLKRLKGVSSPEKKRKIIGRAFIEVFNKEAKKFKDAGFLAQGTLYPDIIESVSVKGPSATIKSHHNVGGLPKRMKLKLVEPLRFLFKDEVRALGKELDIADDILSAHPFPGPGLAVRILGSIKWDDLEILRAADAIVREELHLSGWDKKSWQAFAVLLPVKAVGVMGDERTYEKALAIRCVNSTDGMTADWTRLPYDLLHKMSSRIISEIKGINKVVYDITSKPPSTIEWE